MPRLCTPGAARGVDAHCRRLRKRVQRLRVTWSRWHGYLPGPASRSGLPFRLRVYMRITVDMKSLSIGQLRQNLTVAFDEVERGETVIVTRYRKEIGRIVPGGPPRRAPTGPEV